MFWLLLLNAEVLINYILSNNSKEADIKKVNIP